MSLMMYNALDVWVCTVVSNQVRYVSALGPLYICCVGYGMLYMSRDGTTIHTCDMWVTVCGTTIPRGPLYTSIDGTTIPTYDTCTVVPSAASVEEQWSRVNGKLDGTTIHGQRRDHYSKGPL